MHSLVERRYPLLLWALVFLGLCVRIASAQGGLWLDEAWSAQLARDAGTPIGVFLNINHDNNHHLNSLWLQFVGFDAPPLLQRALSIVTGTIAIPVAALILRPRGRIVALIAAMLFAFSPIFVSLGSEARGYAPMMLAFLTAIVLIDRWLDGRGNGMTPRYLGWCFALGALSQLTMVFGCIALIGWVFFALCTKSTASTAAKRAMELLTPAVVALLGVLGVIAGAAYLSPTGFQIGSYEPFTMLSYLHGIVEMLAFLVGLPLSLWLIPVAVTIVILGPTIGAQHLALYRLAIIAFPITLALLHAGNLRFARYYLIAGAVLLLLLAETIGWLIAKRGWQKTVAVTALVAVFIGSAVSNAELIENQRADPDLAMIAMIRRAPRGATVLIDNDSGRAVINASAAHAHYPIIVIQSCATAQFLFFSLSPSQKLSTHIDRCGSRYRRIASARARGLSGTHWTLYERQP